MFKRILPILALAASLFGCATEPALAQSQPVQWRYDFQQGVATATYPGQVKINGSQINTTCLSVVYSTLYNNCERAPVFIWFNPDNTNPAGKNAGLQVWVGDNPTGTPGAGDTVGMTLNVNNGNNRVNLWGTNILTGRCGPAEGCPAGYVDGPTVGNEIDVYGSLSWLPANRAFNASAGTYVIEGQQIYCQGPQYCTAGLTIWSTLANGNNWWREGIAMNRIANIGLHFEKTAGDTGTQLSVAAIQDDSNSANVIQVGTGTHTTYFNAPNAVINATGTARFGNQGEAIGVTNYVVVGGSTGSSGIELNRGGTVGLYCTTDGTSYGQCNTNSASIPLKLGMNNGDKLILNSANVTALQPVILPTYTVAGLPTCNAGLAGGLARVSDATAPTYNGALTGGGAVVVPVFCNGTAWTSH